MRILGVGLYKEERRESGWHEISGHMHEVQLGKNELGLPAGWPPEEPESALAAVVYHNLTSILRRSPKAVMWVQQGRPSERPLRSYQRLFEGLQWVGVKTPFAILLDGRFHHAMNWEFDAYLFLGEGDIPFEFVGSVVSPRFDFHTAFFFGTRPFDLKTFTKTIEGSRRPDEILPTILSDTAVDTYFDLNDEGDFALMTRDEEVAEGFLAMHP